MRKRTHIGVATRPVSLSAAIRTENPGEYGTIAQALDLIGGDYAPNRTVYPTLLGLHVLMEDPNTQGGQSEVAWTGRNTVSWEYEKDGVTTAVTALSTGAWTLSGQQLRVAYNQTAADGVITVRARGSFYDSTGRAQQAVAEVRLTLNTSVATNIALLRDHDGEVGYCGNFYRLNPLRLETPAQFKASNNWMRMCAVQLCDGTTPIPDAFPAFGDDPLDDDDYPDTPEGSAFYFWFYRTPGGRLVQCTEDTEWFDAGFTVAGTASKEVYVNLTKVRQVKLVCRAGYIPYGQLSDYVDADGQVRPEKLFMGFRELEFDVGVDIPDVERIVVADIANCQIERTALSSGTVTVVKRALITAGGTTVNDLGIKSPSSADTLLSLMYAVNWWLTDKNGAEQLIGTGEWLQTTPAEMAAAYGKALSADAMPQITVEVEPRYPKLTGNNYVEGYQRGAGAAQSNAAQRQGNSDFLKQTDFFLIDTTDNRGDTTRPMKLQRNNLLRFAGGGWAPVVCISEDMAADATLPLSRKDASGNYVPYCGMGEYDPEAFVENVLRPYYKGFLTGWPANEYPKLYKVTKGGYAEAHALLPWETTETKYTIGVGFAFGVYLLDHMVGKSGWEWNGILTDTTEWDGIDLTPYYLAPTAIAPCPSVAINDDGKTKLRNFFFLSRPNGGNGHAGLVSGITMFKESGRAYPTTGYNTQDIMDYARNNNFTGTAYVYSEDGPQAIEGDTLLAIEKYSGATAGMLLVHGAETYAITAVDESKDDYDLIYLSSALKTNIPAGEMLTLVRESVPFAEGGFFALNAMISAQELLYHRRDIITVFGSGISSIDPCSTLAEWRTNGGIRHRPTADGSYAYARWGDNADISSSSGGSVRNWNMTLASEYAKEQCMESQMAMSFAVEFGIAATSGSTPTYFEMYGGKYYWREVDGVEGPRQGYLNCKVYREMSQQGVSCYDTSGNAQAWNEVACVLRMSLMAGMNLTGDIIVSWPGGMEAIGMCEVNPSGSKVGNRVRCLLISDQRRWVRDTAIQKEVVSGHYPDELTADEQFLIELSPDAVELTGWKKDYDRTAADRSRALEPTNRTNGHISRRLSYTSLKMADNGGSMTTYECAYGSTQNLWSSAVNRRVRLAQRFRNTASSQYCSPRTWHCDRAASFSYRDGGCSMQVAIGT